MCGPRLVVRQREHQSPRAILVILIKMPLRGSGAATLAKQLPGRSRLDLKSTVELIHVESQIQIHFFQCCLASTSPSEDVLLYFSRNHILLSGQSK